MLELMKELDRYKEKEKLEKYQEDRESQLLDAIR